MKRFAPIAALALTLGSLIGTTAHAATKWTLTADSVNITLNGATLQGVSPYVEKLPSGDDRIYLSGPLAVPDNILVADCTNTGSCTRQTIGSKFGNDVTIVTLKDKTRRVFFVDSSAQSRTIKYATLNSDGLSHGTPTELGVEGSSVSDKRGWGVPDTVVKPDGNVKVFWVTMDYPPTNNPPEDIISATSTDASATKFTRDGGFRLRKGFVDTKILKATPGDWVMICSTGPTPGQPQKLYIATSQDGNSWNVNPNPITSDAESALDPTGYQIDDNTWRIYYVSTAPGEGTGTSPKIIKRATLKKSDDGSSSNQSNQNNQNNPSNQNGTPPGNPSTSASSTEPDFTITPPSMKYLMVFHGCNSSSGGNCQDPRFHKVFLAQSNDGSHFSLISGWKPYAGSVPTVFRRGNTIYIYNAWTDLRTIDINTGVVHDAGIAKLTTEVTGVEQGGFVDPSIAQQADGRFVLFYLPGQTGGDPAGCGTQKSCTREIRYAEEVAGTDGTRFDPKGTAASKNLTAPNTFSDPDIFFNGSKWVLLVSEGPSTEAFTSNELESTYSSSGLIAKNSGGVPAGFHDSVSGQNWIYTTASLDTSGSSVIKRSISLTGTEQLTTFETVIDSSIYSQEKLTTIASPSLARNDAGIACATCAANKNSSSTPTTSPRPVTASPTPSSTTKTTTTAAKSTTITCVKGKITTKVTGVNPKCPTGYTKK